jgi:hypothetical protein
MLFSVSKSEHLFWVPFYIRKSEHLGAIVYMEVGTIVLGAILYTEVGTFVFGTYCGISRRGIARKIMKCTHHIALRRARVSVYIVLFSDGHAI